VRASKGAKTDMAIQDEYKLPLDAIVIVAEYLAGEKCQATLASLNVASKAVREYTSSILYETLILIMDEERREPVVVVPCENWKYTR
jgi:hypothetical protein